jgi:hypothetical protein
MSVGRSNFKLNAETLLRKDELGEVTNLGEADAAQARVLILAPWFRQHLIQG